ncbi:MAG: ketose-bisphosphate aldolase [Actinomycetes bacterium]
MTLARLRTLLDPAAAAGTGVGAFNVLGLEHAEATVAGAEAAGCPVVLQISQNAVRYHGALEPLAAATLALARQAAVPVGVHLDHATDPALVAAAIGLGVTSVMFDGSTLRYADNLAATRAVVERGHAAGVDVEAELGQVGGKEGAHTPGVRTDPEQAAEFVATTGVDALAVAVGSEHAMTERRARLDLDLVARLRAAVPVPLVLHGSSGVPDGTLVAGVRAGLVKINIGTHLNGVFTAAVRARLASDPDLVDPRKYLAPARDGVCEEVARLLRLLAGR